MQLIFEQVRTGGDRNFGYLVGDRDAGCGVLIDPSYSPAVLVQRAIDQGLQVTHIVNTHGHADHTEGNPVAVELTRAPVAAHPDAPSAPDVALADGQELGVGAFRLRCLHTPGHCDDHAEMMHIRIIPLDGAPHVDAKIQGWMGDSRGHWDGGTLVVETTNFDPKGWISSNASAGRMHAVPQN